MVNSIYITSDKPGLNSGGGIVTLNEYYALLNLGFVKFYNGDKLPAINDPFVNDAYMCGQDMSDYQLAHFYAGTFSKTVKRLMEKGTCVTYTVAAHDKELSKQEHLSLGIRYNYPHMDDQKLFEQYVEGCISSNVLICPSQYSKKVMLNYGAKNVIVIPHGINRIEKLPFVDKFTVGYLGSGGLDKGLIYLLYAWEKLKYNTETLRIVSKGIHAYYQIIQQLNSGNIILNTFINDIAHFFGNIHLYVQPSVTEGFGLEVLEALSFGRPVICTENTGAADLIKDGYNGYVVPIRDPAAIADRINHLKHHQDELFKMSDNAIESATNYKWEVIRGKYLNVWTKLIGDHDV
jgi:glycosyltransferase involved in cell wall biosynthesis